MTEIADGKYIFDTVKVGERGQIVISLKKLESLLKKSDDISIVTGDKRKTIITILKANAIKHFALEFARATRKKHQPKKKPEEKDQWKGFHRIP
ncbi:MAG: AbrB family transcriptional regulator [Candidatus Bathyarchaeota archaeon]|nr:AbrB family transcriptional regulator [Candidatus Bathyarchaeota archaeon]